MTTLTIEEAVAQLKAADEEVERIQARIRELSQKAIGHQQRDRELAVALMAGADVEQATIVSPPMSPAQVRRGIDALEALLADASSKQVQARGALRSARANRLKELFQQAAQTYDTEAQNLMGHYCRVAALAEKMAGVRGINPLGNHWWRLMLPRALTLTDPYRFDGLCWVESGTDLTQGVKGNAGRAEVAELLRSEGVEG
jgi:hypothetical protein